MYTTTELDYEEIQTAARLAARTQRLVTADDVWDVVDAPYGTRAERSLVGTVLKDMARRGELEKTGQYIRSVRPQAHGNLMTVWRSRLTPRKN